MKVSKKELYLLLALVGVIIAICSWQFGFRKINEKTDVLRAETKVLEADIQKYSGVKDNIELYQKGIESAANQIAGILSNFPVDVLPEDAIMLGREFEKNNLNTYVEGVGLGTKTNMYNVTSQPVEATTIPTSYSLYELQVNVSYTTSYQGLKDMFDYIYEHKNRMSVNNFAVAYDTNTGLLSGATLVEMYYVTGTDKEYTQQNLSGVTIGTDNIFGTIDVDEE